MTPSSGWYNASVRAYLTASSNSGWKFFGWLGKGASAYTGNDTGAMITRKLPAPRGGRILPRGNDLFRRRWIGISQLAVATRKHPERRLQDDIRSAQQPGVAFRLTLVALRNVQRLERLDRFRAAVRLFPHQSTGISGSELWVQLRTRDGVGRRDDPHFVWSRFSGSFPTEKAQRVRLEQFHEQMLFFIGFGNFGPTLIIRERLGKVFGKRVNSFFGQGLFTTFFGKKITLRCTHIRRRGPGFTYLPGSSVSVDLQRQRDHGISHNGVQVRERYRLPGIFPGGISLEAPEPEWEPRPSGLTLSRSLRASRAWASWVSGRCLSRSNCS